MTNLPTDFELDLLAARGFCELGHWQDAWNELEGMEPEQRGETSAIVLRLRIFVGLERYESAAALAESLAAKGDQTPEVWLQGAESIRYARSATEALSFLKSAEPFLLRIAAFHYMLARLACLVGNHSECRKSLERCFALDLSFRLKALDDPDLTPFW